MQHKPRTGDQVQLVNVPYWLTELPPEARQLYAKMLNQNFRVEALSPEGEYLWRVNDLGIQAWNDTCVHTIQLPAEYCELLVAGEEVESEQEVKRSQVHEYWWISTRYQFIDSDDGWDDYIQFVGLRGISEIRSIDPSCNRHLFGSANCALHNFQDVRKQLSYLPLPQPVRKRSYYLLFADAMTKTLPENDPDFTLLGFDLADEFWTSSLLNRGRWTGELERIAHLVNIYGLLSLDDAILARRKLHQVWPDHPGSEVRIWALYEVNPMILRPGLNRSVQKITKPLSQKVRHSHPSPIVAKDSDISIEEVETERVVAAKNGVLTSSIQ